MKSMHGMLLKKILTGVIWMISFQYYPNYGKAGILKNISDFKDAESEEDPISLKSINWIQVRDKIGNELRNYIHLLQQKQLEAQKETEDSIKRIIKKENKN